MGATHKNSADPWTKGTLGWNSNTKKHGGFKRQVRCFLLDRGYSDTIEVATKLLQGFGKHLGVQTPSCKIIVENHWTDFKDYIDHRQQGHKK